MTQTPPRGLWAEMCDTSFSQGWIDVGDIRTRYLRAGDATHAPLILLHGSGGHAEAYLRNLKAHGQYFDTWAIDMVGHGWSSKPDTPYEISVYVDHVVRFMDKMGWEKAHVSGESLGGWVATHLAIFHPDRLQRVVLNTAGGFRADTKVMETIKTLSMKAAEDPSWEFIKARMEWLMKDPADATPDLIACRQAIYSQPGFVRAMTNIMVTQDMEIRRRSMVSDDQIRSISAPTLVLWTSDDPSAPAEVGRRVADLIPGAQFTMLEDCGHWPQWEDAETFNRVHINFLLDRPLDASLNAVGGRGA